MTTEELKARFPHASAEFIRRNASDAAPAPAPRPAHPAPPAVLERRDALEPLEGDKAQERGAARFVVRVNSRRVRLCDEDNLCEKFLVDGLRYAGIIPSDAPDRCRIIPTQTKVRHYAEEETEIVITRHA